jgi:hypothetical protein
VAWKTIPLTDGLYENVDPEELPSTELAVKLENLIMNEAGSNIDRPALSLFATIGNQRVVGSYFWKLFDVIVVVTFDRRIYSVTEAGVITEITGGATLGGTERASFAEDGTLLAIAGGGAPQYWTGAGVCALMGGAPPDTKSIVYLDGYWIAATIDDQIIQWAGPTEVLRATWSAGNFFSAEAYPDDLAALYVLFRELWAFGTESIEVFQNIGSSGVPFQRVFAFDRGLAATFSLVQADNTLWYLDSQRRFVRMEGKTPQIISGPISRTLKQMETISDCWGARIDIDGYMLILWSFPTEEKTYAYDYLNKKWYRWYTYHDTREVHFAASSYSFASTWNKHYVGGQYSGILSELSRSFKTDNADPLRRVRRTGMLDHGTGDRKRSRGYRFHVKRGLGTPGGVEPLFEFRFNDDNQGWTDPVEVGLGFPGDPKEPIYVPVGGIYRKREFEYSCSAAVEFMLTKVEENVEGLVS